MGLLDQFATLAAQYNPGMSPEAYQALAAQRDQLLAGADPADRQAIANQYFGGSLSNIAAGDQAHMGGSYQAATASPTPLIEQAGTQGATLSLGDVTRQDPDGTSWVGKRQPDGSIQWHIVGGGAATGQQAAAQTPQGNRPGGQIPTVPRPQGGGLISNPIQAPTTTPGRTNPFAPIPGDAAPAAGSYVMPTVLPTPIPRVNQQGPVKYAGDGDGINAPKAYNEWVGNMMKIPAVAGLLPKLKLAPLGSQNNIPGASTSTSTPVTGNSPNERRHGGPVPDDGDSKLEPVPVTAHEGEYVIKPEAVRFYGQGLFGALNAMKVPRSGLMAGPRMPPMRRRK